MGMSEQNKALVRRWIAEIDRRNFAVADELVAADYIDHNPPLPGTAHGREGVKQTNAMLYSAFPDAHHTIEEQIAEADKVVTRMTVTGHFQG
jgi:predicted ester cyclase